MKELIIHDLNNKETVEQIIEMFKNEDRRDNQDIKRNFLLIRLVSSLDC